jgi:YebC/PmpR family DNA-binding regulatory protein
VAGHSKWANIQYRKGVQDAKRGKIFTKYIREITVAARTGGGDPAINPRLRHAIDRALGVNMSKDNIERAIKRGNGELEGASYEEVRYEGYAPGGVAVIVDGQTDNRTRTVGEVRYAFSKYGGNLGTDGSVAYLFKKTGVIILAPGASEDKVMEIGLDAGAEDVLSNDDGSIEVLTTFESLTAVREAIEKAGLKPASAVVTERPALLVPLAGDDAERVLKLLEVLEDLDDVQNVYTNADFPESLLARH